MNGGMRLIAKFNNLNLRIVEGSKGQNNVAFDANPEDATIWVLKSVPEIPFGKEVHIITSRDTYLQTNSKEEIKHFRKLDGRDPRTRWIITRDGPVDVCIFNVGTGKYMMTPNKGVETWWSSCHDLSNRAHWAVMYGVVDDERGAAFTIQSKYNQHFLSAHGDDENWVSVDRKTADTWEHFDIRAV
eukprot:m51a1_g10713 hypothetical protein (186) ;mRNA; r:191340-191962